MDVIIQPSAAAAAALTARLIAQAIRGKPNLVLGLATGRTMEPVYAELARRNRVNGLDFSQVQTFNLDEYVGLGADHPQSYRHYMNAHLFSKVNIDLANTRLPDGTAEDITAECQLYEDEIRSCGGIDLQLLGIGRSGHIGFNEPTSSLQSRTRRTVLTRETFEQNSPLFDDPAQMPRSAVTMGVGTILEARECVMLITGAEKAGIAAKAIEGPLTAMVTASALQLHPECAVILDAEAAAGLQLQDFYNWNWEHSPRHRMLA